ncbi:MAG: hypothetical protein A2X50_08405 [Candidatus Rokubacteria bacterium GWF2_70_14]|nr:MAG: hypothetical protein A2X50_08405 [Candidatus Rokubacteria bacterium GWF2_70_14]
MTKREFVRGLVAGAVVAAVRPGAARAERFRILGGAPGAETLLVEGRSSAEFRTLVTGVTPGGRRAYGALEVLWLRGAVVASPLAAATLDEARAAGTLTVVERERPTVPALLVENRGTTHVLLLAGEILLGGKQNRVVVEDVLLPPRSGPVDLQVYCVEQGRWSGAARGFGGGDTVAAPGLRAKVLERRGQDEVWREVDRYAARLAAPSATSSYQAMQDAPGVRAHRQDAERALGAGVPPGTLGAAAFVGGGFAGLDLFADPGLFAREWPKLLRAHAVEAYARRGAKPADADALGARVAQLLRAAGAAEGVLRQSAGVGRLFEFRVAGARGAALVAEGQVVHAAIL